MSTQPSWHDKLLGGFRRTSDRLVGNLAGLGGARLDESTLESVFVTLTGRDIREERRDLLVPEYVAAGITDLLRTQALIDYEAGRYYSTVLVLLSVMDGFVNDLAAFARHPALRRVTQAT